MTKRFGVSMGEELLEQFDRLIERKEYENRSEAIRDLIRDRLVQQQWTGEKEVVGVVTLLYDHHRSHLSDQLTATQHQDHELVLATTHIHLDQDNCLEMIAVKGEAEQIDHLASELIGRKGVKHGKLSATSTGSDLE